MKINTWVEAWGYEPACTVDYDIEEGAPGKPNYVVVNTVEVDGTDISGGMSDHAIAVITERVEDLLYEQSGMAPRTFWGSPISRGMQ